MEEIVDRYFRELPEQYSEIGRGAQFKVVMLTNPELSSDTVSDEEFTIPRVMKIPLSHDAIAQSVSTWNYRELDPDAKARQMGFSRLRATTIMAAHKRADTEVWHLAARPVYVVGGGPEVMSDYLYIQDYVMPISELLKSYDPNSRKHRGFMRKIMQRCVEVQAILLDNETLEPTFKIADNYGLDQDSDVVIHDFFEMQLRADGIAQVIKDKAWERVATNPEATKLPHDMQQDFNNGCEALFSQFSGLALTDQYSLVGNSTEIAEHHDNITGYYEYYNRTNAYKNMV
jgi:hypothetical protein